ncbi:MAG TPA: SDR family oxidoreductase [Pirellulales bacterium]|jgi:enoyl-[acyl-carrier protein] reductase III
MIDLHGKVALVTGSSRGIGRATALRLAEAGADIIVNYVVNRQAANELAEQIAELGRNVLVVKADVSEQDDVRSMMDAIKERFGKLDILVSNAATGGFRPLMAATGRNFQAAYSTNVLALLYLVQSALPLMKRAEGAGRSKVIALSSHGSHMALPFYGLIGSSKAALESLVRHLTLEVGNLGVNVNVIKAGLVETDSTRRIPGADVIFNARKDRSMMGERMLTADDVADTVLFLASPLSDLVQGETLTVDGGAAVHP